MRIKIPESAQGPLSLLMGLPVDKFSQLVLSLKKAKPVVDFSALAREVSKSTGLPFDVTRGVVQTIGELILVRSSEDKALSDFIDDICGALQEIQKPELMPKLNPEQIKERLTQILSQDGAITVAAKATHLMTAHQRTAEDSRIITDMRPVFQTDGVDSPLALIVTHSLVLEFHEHDQRKELYFGCDKNDLLRLRHQIDRALKKAESLKRLLKEKEIPFFESF